MHKVVERPSATRDIEKTLKDLTDRDGSSVAEEFIESLSEAYDQLSPFPNMGAPYKGQNSTMKGLRIWALPKFSNYLLFYIPTDTAIEIVRVLHGARDLPSILSEPQE